MNVGDSGWDGGAAGDAALTFHRLPFESVFTDESGGNVKTPQGEYLPDGEFPVVDQGKALIGGYTDDRSRLCGEGRSAIVFGDHTRCIKYVDFPFCMGADGVKVLRPRIDADLKYLYYFLCSLDLPSAGYDRHYKYLKRFDVLVPPIPEQRRIAAILDQADALRTKRREALTQLDSLTQSIFTEMFGDPARNTKGWSEVTIADICEVKGGKRLPKGEDYSATPTSFRYIRVTDIRSGSVDESKLVFLTPEVQSTISRYIVNAGDVIISIAGSIGMIAPVFTPLAGANLTENAAKLVPRANAPLYDHVFLAKALQTPFSQDQISSHVGQVTIGKLALFRIEKVRLPLPPIDAQRRFARSVEAVARLRRVHQASTDEVDALFASLQRHAFAGQLS